MKITPCKCTLQALQDDIFIFYEKRFYKHGMGCPGCWSVPLTTMVPCICWSVKCYEGTWGTGQNHVMANTKIGVHVSGSRLPCSLVQGTTNTK